MLRDDDTFLVLFYFWGYQKYPYPSFYSLTDWVKMVKFSGICWSESFPVEFSPVLFANEKKLNE